MRYEIRPVAPAEWRESRELRLAALRDPVSAIAFEGIYDAELALSDDVWQRRSSGVGAQQFVAVATAADEAGAGQVGDGQWVGMAVAVAERADYYSLNAVYLRPEARGTGVAEKLFAAAIAWTWDRADRLYLWVHEDNARAEAFYRRLGFVRTGKSMAFPRNPARSEYELVLIRG